LRGALTTGADRLLGTLGPEEQQTARRLLLALVKIGRGTTDTGRALTRDEALASACGESPDPAERRAAEAVLTRLSGGREPDATAAAPALPRLVVADGDRVELVHDALTRHWETLRGWIEADREALERRDDLEAAAGAWHGAGRPDDGLPGGELLAYYARARSASPAADAFLDAARRLARRRRRVRQAALAGLVGALVVVSGLALYALAQERLAEERLGQAVGVANRIVFVLERRLRPVAGAAEVRRELLGEALGLLETLRPNAEDDANTLRNLASSHVQRGDLALTHDDLDVARAEYEAAKAILDRLASNVPDDMGRHRDLSVILNQLGKLAVAEGRLADARQAFEQTLASAWPRRTRTTPAGARTWSSAT
jgi:tetratricopeptide (TPR) repeat protein